jgi:hypothetical protein
MAIKHLLNPDPLQKLNPKCHRTTLESMKKEVRQKVATEAAITFETLS